MTNMLANDKIVNLHYSISDQTHGLFPISGQGTVSVSPRLIGDALHVILSTPDGSSVGITISRTEFELWEQTRDKRSILAKSKDPALLLNQSDTDAPYWLSFDKNNKRIRYGKGEMLRHLQLLEFSWADKQSCDLDNFSRDIHRIDIEGAKAVEIKILSVPVSVDPSPHIIPGSAVTMEILAMNAASVIDDLPIACHRLYANISGPCINLAPADFPEFAQAIQYSIITPGRLCHEKLRKKDSLFGYLRVTLDANMGDSPGQPYVLEIWPAGNGSPIHDHGKACAVIKVLHGQIRVSWFGTLSPNISQPWGSMIAHAGDVTFLTPDYYQIHQLHNPSPVNGGDFCATLQCYRYSDDDSKHCEYFDYIKDGKTWPFVPDSDWGYLEFKQAIKDEWEDVVSAAA